MTTDSSVRPRDWSVPPSDVLLADGTIAVIRSLRPDDREQLLALHEGVSVDTLRLRFFSSSPSAGRAYVAHLFDESNTESVALVAVVRGRIAALATAELLTGESAEVAFLVSDQDRGRGLGSLLLEHLAALGREHGVSRFEAEVLAENYGMLGVFRGAGFAVSRQTQDGEVSVELRTEASAAVIDAADRREWRSEARSLRPLLYPESVAVVGVSRRAAGLGHAVLEGIRSAGFAGRLYVVHPEADAVAGLPAHRTLTSIGEPVDLVVIVVPADRVAEVMADACAAGVGAAIVVSSGLSGRVRSPRARELLELARAHSVRVVGPDSQGVLSWGAGVRLNATFARALPEPGGLAVASQSGGVGFTLLDLARRARRGRALVRLARRQAGRLQQRPAGRVDGRRPGERGRAPSRVVRQRHEVRADRPPVRGAQALAGRGRRPGREHLGRRRRALRPVGRDRVPQRHRAGRDRGAAGPAAPARGVPGRRGDQRRAGWACWPPIWPTARGSPCPRCRRSSRPPCDGPRPARSAPATPSTSAADLDPADLAACVGTLLRRGRGRRRGRGPGPHQPDRPGGTVRGRGAGAAGADLPVLLVASGRLGSTPAPPGSPSTAPRRRRWAPSPGPCGTPRGDAFRPTSRPRGSGCGPRSPARGPPSGSRPGTAWPSGCRPTPAPSCWRRTASSTSASPARDAEEACAAAEATSASRWR